jgi:hypothetical protein
VSSSAFTVFPANSAGSFCCKLEYHCRWSPCKCLFLLSLSFLQSLHGVPAVNLEFPLSQESLQVSFSVFCVTVFPAISAWSFCFKVGVPFVAGVPACVFLCCHCLAISAGSFCCKPGVPVVTGVHSGVFLCCHCLPPAISSWSFCCKPGVPVVAGVPAGVFFCCHCLPSYFSMEFLL